LDWIGLDWIGLDWIGLDWIGLDWIGAQQTLHPFSQILKISSRNIAPIVAPTSDNFQICFIRCKVLFFLEKKMQTASKSA